MLLSTPAPLSVEMSTLVTLLMVPGAQVPLVAVCRCRWWRCAGAQVPLGTVRRCRWWRCAGAQVPLVTERPLWPLWILKYEAHVVRLWLSSRGDEGLGQCSGCSGVGDQAVSLKYEAHVVHSWPSSRRAGREGGVGVVERGSG